jgi:hypothetical protein
MGNIDCFTALGDGDEWELEGDWGTLRVRQPTVELVFDQPHMQPLGPPSVAKQTHSKRP